MNKKTDYRSAKSARNKIVRKRRRMMPSPRHAAKSVKSMRTGGVRGAENQSGRFCTIHTIRCLEIASARVTKEKGKDGKSKKTRKSFLNLDSIFSHAKA